LLRRGGLQPVYHAGSDRATLKEVPRTYANVVEDRPG
jgi:hypothetical protein